jgi:hypothetical protein
MTETVAGYAPQDEYMHQPSDHPAFNESTYFQVFDEAAGTAAMLRIGNRVNAGHAEVTVVVFLPDGRTAFSFARVPIADNGQFDAGGLRVEVREPLHRVAVHFRGPVKLLENGTDLADPGRALAAAPEADLDLVFEYTNIADIYAGTDDRGDGAARDLLRSELADGHYRAACRVEGVISIGGRRHEIGAFGFRDHSWGPRVWNQPQYWRWLCAIADERNWFDVFVLSLGGGRQEFGIVCRDGVVGLVDDIAITSAHGGDPHYLESVAAELTMSGTVLRVAGRTTSQEGRPRVVPLRHRRGDEIARIAEMAMTFEVDGARFLGWAEYHDRIVDGIPIGMAEA